MGKKIELVTNLIIIAVALLLGVVLVKNHLIDGGRGRHTNIKEIEAGAKLALPGVDWEKNGKTMLLVLSSKCHFCTQSAPFYQRLAQETMHPNRPKLVAVFPSSDQDSKKYLSEIGVSIDDVRQAALDSIGIAGTPFLILVDKTGVVTKIWRGQLPTDEEDEVLSRMREGCDCG